MRHSFDFAPGRPNDAVIAFGRVFANQAAVDKWTAEADRLAGRQVTTKELSSEWGVHLHTYTQQPPRVHAEDRLWQPIVEAKQDSNPYRAHGQGVIDKQRREREGHGLPVDREKRYADLAREYDAKQAAEKAATSHAEAIKPVREAAQALHDRLRFDPSVPLDELRAVVRATKQIDGGGDLGIARQMLGDALAVETDRLVAAETSLKAELEGKLAEIKAKLVDRPNVEAPYRMTREEFLALDPAERAKSEYAKNFRPVDND